MDKVKSRRIAPGERRKLHRMKRQRRNHVNVSHARIILLSSGGVCNRELAERVGVTAHWVRKIIHRLNAHGLAGIEWWPGWHVPVPRRFFADIVEQVAEVALSSPQSLIGMNQWSLSKLRSYLVSQKILGSISPEWLRELLLRAGIRWRHTKTWKESNDPDFWAKYRRIRRLYHHRPGNGRRICVDEFGPLNLQPRHGTCFTKKGRRSVDRHRATYHRFGGVRHFFAAYDLETGHLFGRFAAHKKWSDFLAFLKWLRRRYRPQETLHIVLDNYKPHLKHEVLAWAKTHHVKFYFTPTNASWINRIECPFTALKKFALDNSDYNTHEALQEAIISYLDWRNRRRQIAVEPWRRKVAKTKHSHVPATAL